MFFVKIVSLRCDTGDPSLITVGLLKNVSHFFEISEFLLLLLQDIDTEQKNQTPWVGRASVRNVQEPDAG